MRSLNQNAFKNQQQNSRFDLLRYGLCLELVTAERDGGGGNSILISMVLDWNVQQGHLQWT